MVAVTETAARAPARRRVYGPREELANTLTHGAGTMLALVGLVLLVAAALSRGGWYLASAVGYGLGMVARYASSTLYHGLSAPRAKHACKIADHASIYLLVAGPSSAASASATRRCPAGLKWELAVS
jgi:hemolysin III